MSCDDIQSRQNEESQLKIQYAARVYYNRAEVANYFVWLLCITSALCIFIPEDSPVLLPWGLPIALDLTALCGIYYVKHKVKIAAQLRNYFDAYVLDIGPALTSESDRRRMREISNDVYSKKSASADTQIANTGKDYPPGVRDWYVFPDAVSGASAQLECQRQNAWWNNKLSQKRLFPTILTGIAVVVTFFLLGYFKGMLIAIFCFAGLVLKAIDLRVENSRYKKISTKLDGALEALEGSPTKEGVLAVQKLIDERRTCAVLEMNWLHKKFAKTFTKAYEDSLR